MRCLQKYNPKSSGRNIASELIRLLEEIPAIVLKLVFRLVVFTSKIPYDIADFKINMARVRKVLAAFHFYTLRLLKPV